MNVLSKQMEHISLTDRIISETTGSLPISVIINDESKMEVVKAFNNELVSLYDIKPPISKAKMTAITKAAMKSVKFYKHVVHGVEKFILKCRPDYKIPGLYVIDSIVRQSRHQFGIEKDVFAPRFSKNLLQTFKNICLCPEDDKQKLVRVINLWQKHKVFPEDLLKKFLVMAEASEEDLSDLYKDEIEAIQKSSKKSPTSGKKKKKSPAKSNFESTGLSTPLQNSFYSSVTPFNNNNHATNAISRSINFNDSASKNTVDPALIQQLQTLTTLLQQSNVPNNNTSPVAIGTPGADQVKFDKKLLEYDYGEEEEEISVTSSSITPSVAPADSIASILTNPDILRQLQTLQVQLSMAQAQAKPSIDQQSAILEQQRMLQNQQMQTFNQTLIQQQYQQECNSNFYGAGFQSSILEGASLSNMDDDADDKPEIVMEKHPTDPLEVIDLDHIATPPSEKSPRRSYSRSRSRSGSRSCSRSHRTRSRRSRSKSWNRERSKDHERNEERRRKALPPTKRKHLAVCSTTLWVGHLSKLVQEQDLSDTFGEFGDIVSIDLIPPRGCAFLCMNRRQDADRALHRLKNTKIQGKAITIAWAPGKGMKGREWKDYWEVEFGVSYIPWNKLTRDTDYDLLEEGGMLDQETMPDWLKAFLEEKRKFPYSKSSKLLYTPSGTDMDESSNECEENTIHSHSNDMIIESTNDVSEQMIPLPDGPQPASDMPPMGIPLPPGQNQTVSQSGPINLPPPHNLLNPFGIPPRLLTPMGVLGGNFIPPIGVPPPVPGLLMSPQHMLNRLPPPFPGPTGLPMINPGAGPSTSLSQIPLPDSSSNLPSVTSSSSSEFKPAFGLTPPLLFPGNPNIKIDLTGNPNMNTIQRVNDDGSILENNNDQLLQNTFKNLTQFQLNTNLSDKDDRNEDTDYRILGDISNANVINSAGLNDNANLDSANKNNEHQDDNETNYNRDRNEHEFDRDHTYRFHDRNNRNFDRDRNSDKYHDRSHRFGVSNRSPFQEGSFDTDKYKQERDSFRRNRFDNRDYKRGRDFRGGGISGRFRDQGLPNRQRGRSRDRDRYKDNRREYADNENKSRRFEKRGRSKEESGEDTHYNSGKKSRWSDKNIEEDWNSETQQNEEKNVNLLPVAEKNWSDTLPSNNWTDKSADNIWNGSINATEENWNETEIESNASQALETSQQNVTNESETMPEHSKGDASNANQTDQDPSTVLILDTNTDSSNTGTTGTTSNVLSSSQMNEESEKSNNLVNETVADKLSFDEPVQTNIAVENNNNFSTSSSFPRFREPRSTFSNRMPIINRGGPPSLMGHFSPNSPSTPFSGLPNFQRTRFQGHRPHAPFFQGPARHFSPFSDSRSLRPFMASRSNNF